MKQHSKTSLFLMELIFSILLFSVCAAICVQLFVKAHQTEKRAADLTKAVLLCDSVAAILQNREGMEPEAFFPELISLSDFQNPDSLGYTACYDEAWKPCQKEQAVWQLYVILTGTAHIFVAEAADSQNLLYELSVGY